MFFTPAGAAFQEANEPMKNVINTFSIVAYDPDEDAFGVGVASKFLAVGAIVPWARAGIGGVATQAMGKYTFGPDGLALMAQGLSASEALARLLANDPGRENRQVGLVDARGGVAAHTGRDCLDFAGHRLGENFTVQGNILAGPQVLDAMVETYRNASGDLATRLVQTLQAAEDAGGDRRGKQSAALVVAKANAGYGGDNDRYLDLRVDDDPRPIGRLAELVTTHFVFFGQPRAEDAVPVTKDLARELQTMLAAQGFYAGEVTGEWDAPTRQAFDQLVSVENLEERWSLAETPDAIDRVALDYLRMRFGRK
jgi:uncharacterized Ntn-hydrolase superfamily protein